jgi:hypothetical protein
MDPNLLGFHIDSLATRSYSKSRKKTKPKTLNAIKEIKNCDKQL